MVKIKFTPQHSKTSMPSDPEQSAQIDDYVQMLKNMSDEERQAFFQHIEQQLIEEDDFDFLDDDFLDDDFFSDDLDNVDEYIHFPASPEIHKYTIQVTILDTDPIVYRKFVVPSNICLRYLSAFIISLFNWDHISLIQFCKGHDYYIPDEQRDESNFIELDGIDYHKQELHTIADLLSQQDETITFEYNIDPDLMPEDRYLIKNIKIAPWLLEVRLTNIDEYSDDEPIVSFIEGQSAPPPDNCGGPAAYRQLLGLYEKREADQRLTRKEIELLDYHLMTDEFDFAPDVFDQEDCEMTCEVYCQ